METIVHAMKWAALLIGLAGGMPGFVVVAASGAAAPGTPAIATPGVREKMSPQAHASALKEQTLRVAEEVAAAYPDDALGQALLGSAYFNSGKSTEAIRHLTRCIELEPRQKEASIILARIAYEKGELEESVRLLRQALASAPANSAALNPLGQSLLDLGHLDEARLALQEAAGLPGATSETHYLLGQVGLQSGNFEQARDSFRRAIAAAPNHTQAYFGLFTACQRLGQTDEATQYQEQFLKLEAIDRLSLTERSASEDTLTGMSFVSQTMARTLFGAGQIHQLHQHPDEATELFRQAALLDDRNPGYRAALEAIHVRRHKVEEGLRIFEQLAAEQPANGLNEYYVGRFHGRLGHIAPAAQAYRRVQTLAPSWPDGYRAQAELYLRAGAEPREALALARRALALEPSARHYHLLAVACVENNDPAEALTAIRKAVDLAPGEARYQSLLKQLDKTP